MEFVKAVASDLDGIIKLRQEVLHPGGPRDRVVYAQDELITTTHLIVKDENQSSVIVTGTLILEPEDKDSTDNEYRIRGMAVKDNLRGKGLGSKLLDEFIKVSRTDHIKKIWCNARVIALPLYERRGFVKTGEPFDVPGSGPHYRMQLFL